MAPIKVKNETDLVLSVYVNYYRAYPPVAYLIGEVAPGQEIENKNLQITKGKDYPIIAKDAQGKLVYSEEYSDSQLEKLHWKIVITQADLKQ